MDKRISEKPLVYPDGTVQRRRPRPVQPQSAASSQNTSKVRNSMGAPSYAQSRPQPQMRRQTAAPQPVQTRKPVSAPQTEPRRANQSGTAYQHQANMQPPSRTQATAPQRRPAGKAPQGAIKTPVAPKSRQVKNAPPPPRQNRGGQAKNALPRQNQNRQTKKESSGWIIPDGSPIYTTEGRMYEVRRAPQSGGQPSNRTRTAAGRPGTAQHGTPNMRRSQTRKAPPSKPVKKKKRFAKRAAFWIGAFAKRLLIFFIITAALGFWWYRSEFYSTVNDNGSKINYSVDDGSGTSYEASASSAWSSGVLYADFSALYKSFNMAQVGSLDSMRFIVKEDDVRDSAGNSKEQYIIFTDGSRTATVNGTAVVMESRCRVIGEHIWIPLSFIENYMDGVKVDHTSDSSVVFVSPDKLAAEKENKESKEPKKINASDYPIHVDLRLKRSNAVNSLIYPE